MKSETKEDEIVSSVAKKLTSADTDDWLDDGMCVWGCYKAKCS